MLNPSVIGDLLRYEPDTGFLFWLHRRVDHFAAGRHTARHSCAKWNAIYAGKKAFTCQMDNGYLQGRIFGGAFLAHRVIWALMTGAWPVEQVDHINGDRADNRWGNLREVSHAENGRNVKRPSDNSTGVMGVCLPKRTGTWVAYITAAGRRIHLGSFATLEEAAAARRSAEIEHGFHPNHGRHPIERNIA